MREGNHLVIAANLMGLASVEGVPLTLCEKTGATAATDKWLAVLEEVVTCSKYIPIGVGRKHDPSAELGSVG